MRNCGLATQTIRKTGFVQRLFPCETLSSFVHVRGVMIPANLREIKPGFLIPTMRDLSDSKASSPVKEAEKTVAETAPAAPVAPAQPAPAKPAAASGPASDDPDDLADWLLGDDDDASDETQTIQAALEDLDLPYTPQEPKEEKPEEKKPASGPNSSDAAANLLKNFFKGGR